MIDIRDDREYFTFSFHYIPEQSFLFPSLPIYIFVTYSHFVLFLRGYFHSVSFAFRYSTVKWHYYTHRYYFFLQILEWYYYYCHNFIAIVTQLHRPECELSIEINSHWNSPTYVVSLHIPCPLLTSLLSGYFYGIPILGNYIFMHIFDWQFWLKMGGAVYSSLKSLHILTHVVSSFTKCTQTVSKVFSNQTLFIIFLHISNTLKGNIG